MLFCYSRLISDWLDIVCSIYYSDRFFDGYVFIQNIINNNVPIRWMSLWSMLKYSSCTFSYCLLYSLSLCMWVLSNIPILTIPWIDIMCSAKKVVFRNDLQWLLNHSASLVLLICRSRTLLTQLHSSSMALLPLLAHLLINTVHHVHWTFHLLG